MFCGWIVPLTLDFCFLLLSAKKNWEVICQRSVSWVYKGYEKGPMLQRYWRHTKLRLKAFFFLSLSPFHSDSAVKQHKAKGWRSESEVFKVGGRPPNSFRGGSVNGSERNLTLVNKSTEKVCDLVYEIFQRYSMGGIWLFFPLYQWQKRKMILSNSNIRSSLLNCWVSVGSNK